MKNFMATSYIKFFTDRIKKKLERLGIAEKV